MRRVAWCTFGCRLNQYDTETMRTLVERTGEWESVPPRADADVYVVNTCSVTARADATARKAIRRIHAEQPKARIVVTGCYAQRAPEEIAELPGVSAILGAADRGRIAAAIGAAGAAAPARHVSPVGEAREFLDVPISEMLERSRAFVKVQEGCNESCAFCIVPQTRGRSRSRRPESVLEQARALVDNGYPEVVVTGVHVGDYGLDLVEGRRLLRPLLESMLAIPGLERLRLSSIEPASVTPDLVDLVAGEPRFARHFHIPMQSGSEDVLARMRRRYTAREFATLITGIAERVPGCAIGTDVICGFPGEDEDDFARTFELLIELPITYLHPFTYSVRPGSEAEALGDQVPGDVKKRRTRSLKRLSASKSRAFRERHVGQVLPVLLETAVAAEGTGAGASGLTDNYLRVRVPGATADGALRDVRLTAVTDEGLLGEPVARAG